jgi:hypothetical protein
MLTTKEIISKVRDDLMEYDTNVLTDKTICSRAHVGYLEVLKTLDKSNSTFIKDWTDVEYTEPLSVHELLGRRVEAIRYGKVNLRRAEPYEVKRLAGMGGSPFAYTVMRGRIHLIPSPSSTVTLSILASPRVLQLAPTVGRILRFDGQWLELDSQPTSDMLDYFDMDTMPLVTVSDWETGEPKKLYRIGQVEGNKLKCIEVVDRTEYLGFPLTSVTPTENLPGEDDNIQVDDVVSYGLSTGVPMISDDLTQYVIAWATLVSRGAFNEVDENLREMMAQLVKDLHTECAGQPIGKVRREFNKTNAYYSWRRS